MPLDLTTRQPDWANLQGETLEGGYELTEILCVEDAGATFKVRVLGDHLRRACVNVYPAPPGAADEQLAIWESVKDLRHPNLHLPFAVGRLERDGVELIYQVSEREDERLSGALRERALNREEAGAIMQSITGALEQLHSFGFAHGCVSPEHVLAIGDSILLSTECVRRINAAPVFEIATPKYMAPESTEENVTPAADVWCLGATLFEALTQKEYDESHREEASQLTAPFGLILERCLEPDAKMRMRPADLVQILKQKPAPAPRPEPIPISKATVTPIPPGPIVKSGVAIPKTYQAPVLPREPLTERSPRKPLVEQQARQPLAERQEQREISFEKLPLLPRRVWAYGALALVVVIGLFFLFRPRAQQKPVLTSKSAPRSENSGHATGTASRAWETRTLTPDASAAKNEPPGTASGGNDAARRTPRAASPTPTAAAKREPVPSKGAIWRVVTYAYARADDAAKKAQAINQKHPDLKAESFSPSGTTGPFVVVVGGAMDNRADALRFRQKAVRLGMPHDSYIQNYKQ